MTGIGDFFFNKSLAQHNNNYYIIVRATVHDGNFRQRV